MKKENTLNSKSNYILSFSSIFLLVFVVSFSALSLFGLVPESLQFIPPILEISPYGRNPNNAVFSIPLSQEIRGGTRPDRITIDKVGIDSVIEQPVFRDVTTLDHALSSGAVHYPGSGTIEQGNIFLFGHSTGFSVVNNQAYKTFNGLNKLEEGDLITLEADGQDYEYRVENVYLADDSNVLVEFDSSQRRLTISTCNTFGQKQERWVVEAEFVK
jgi:LPXTG-site transpeptidase (sortase) family protein